ncbi:hypothetical protein CTRI78_v010742 [Colletotrichum trifolii]|uniref:2EXR domain-containing protein n=1 Tax=Colletotrichum trifolii TaxID=5466 RepID=A0A4V3HTK8_COLTR|nr:hypothetical protein CTRI78_v010742 [Colletotrichum trifolii]
MSQSVSHLDVTFHLFVDFPPEIKIAIWEAFYSRPRYFELEVERSRLKRWNPSRITNLPEYHEVDNGIDRMSRSVANSIRQPQAGGNISVNWDIDFIYIAGRHYVPGSGASRVDLRLYRNLVLDLPLGTENPFERFQDIRHWDFSMPNLGLRQPKLKSLTWVANQKMDATARDALYYHTRHLLRTLGQPIELDLKLAVTSEWLHGDVEKIDTPTSWPAFIQEFKGTRGSLNDLSDEKLDEIAAVGEIEGAEEFFDPISLPMMLIISWHTKAIANCLSLPTTWLPDILG